MLQNITHISKSSTMDNNNTNTINYIIRKDKPKTDLALYLFGAAFSPSISTFTKAIRNAKVPLKQILKSTAHFCSQVLNVLI